MTSIYIDSGKSKSDIIDLIKIFFEEHNEDIILIPDENLSNCLFATDLYRRMGHKVNLNIYSDQEGYMKNYIYISCHKLILEKQITRDDIIDDLIEEISMIPDYVSIYKIKSCGTAIDLLWDYAKKIVNHGWYIYKTDLNAIPVHLDSKTIYKTTLILEMCRVY